MSHLPDDKAKGPTEADTMERPPTSPRADVSTDARDIRYLQGLRFWAASILLGAMFFLVSMEISVVTTSLVAITSDIGGFENLSWVLSSYLLGYVSAVVIITKFSDILGRKQILALCISFFTVMSGACAAAQTSTQLIILRAFQGIGGGGCFAMNTIIMVEIVEPPRYGQYVASMGIPSAAALALGPLVGGGLSSITTWRWIFLINLPIGAIALVLCLTSLPNEFPFHEPDGGLGFWGRMTTKALKRIDIVGSLLLLLASLSLTAAVSEADSRFPWRSAYVITLLVASAILWILLLAWERRITLAKGVLEPVLPWRFVVDPALSGTLLGSLLLGGPMMVPVFQLPQRFQIINGLSSLEAGVRLIPYAATVPVGLSAGTVIASRLRVPIVFVAMAGAAVQAVGLALLATLPPSASIPPRTYGYEVLAVGMGAVTQFRLMGGAIILAIATSVFNGLARPSLARLGLTLTTSSSGVPELLSSVPQDTRLLIRNILSKAYNRQMWVLCATALIEMLVLLRLWRKKQIRMPN